jgi:hypothetical protein
VADSLSNLAVDLRELGEHGRARELDEQALAMRQRLAGALAWLARQRRGQRSALFTYAYLDGLSA